MKEIRIENYLRSRNYENWNIKIGNLGNHSKAEFLEINEYNDNNNGNNKQVTE